jgi:hypothetical protein
MNEMNGENPSLKKVSGNLSTWWTIVVSDVILYSRSQRRLPICHSGTEVSVNTAESSMLSFLPDTAEIKLENCKNYNLPVKDLHI